MGHVNINYQAQVTENYPDFFNDVFGPIMQPGSSSEFAAPCRIGNVARALVPEQVARVRFSLSRDGNDAAYLVNFMSDRGYLGGILGLLPDDERLFYAHDLAQQAQIGYDFASLPYNLATVSSVLVEVRDTAGNQSSIVIDSTGGGMIKSYEINGFPIEWIADSYAVLIHDTNTGAEDPNGSVGSRLELLLGEQGAEILSITTHRNAKAEWAYFVETSADPAGWPLWAELSGEPGLALSFLPALLPVVRTQAKQPQLFSTVGQWRALAEERELSFADIAFAYEQAATGWSYQQVWDYFEKIAAIFDGQIHSLERIGYDQAQDTPILPIYGKQWNAYLQTGGCLSDDLTNHILVHAFSTNAKIPGNKIVPGPMGTGGGYLFSALDAVREKHGFTYERLIESLAVAAALGALAYTHTHPTGLAGCTGESGVCCAMASGAVAWLAGGDAVAVENAASMALQANLGIPCDPIPGGLEFPCLTRTFRAATTAPLYADLALAGIDPLIPYHEMLLEVERHYHATSHQELCSLASGCCNTPTARALVQQFSGETQLDLHFEPTP
jgi:L-serine dehydratase